MYPSSRNREACLAIHRILWLLVVSNSSSRNVTESIPLPLQIFIIFSLVVAEVFQVISQKFWAFEITDFDDGVSKIAG